MDETVLELLDYEKLYELIDRRIPQDKSRIMDQMCEFGMIERKDDRYDILNLGAILFARKLKDFGLENKEVIVRKYSGTSKTHLRNMYHTFHSMDSFSLQSKSDICITY